MSDVELVESVEPVKPPPSPRQVLLGLFILFQLFFLIGSNLLGYVMWAPSELSRKPRELTNRLVPAFAAKSGHVWQWGDQLDANWRRWSQLTGQDQNWALFAPTVGKATGFPAVLLIWDEPTQEGPSFPGTELVFDDKNGFNLVADPKLPAERMELMLSENEPKDIHNFLSIGKLRLRRYEGQIYLNPQPYDIENAEELAERLKYRMQKLVREYHGPALEYLRWRLNVWQSQHRERPKPKQVVLMHRLYDMHGPEEPLGWEGPFMVPLARWQPDALRDDLFHALEPFDFSEKRFVPMSR